MAVLLLLARLLPLTRRLQGERSSDTEQVRSRGGSARLGRSAWQRAPVVLPEQAASVAPATDPAAQPATPGRPLATGPRRQPLSAQGRRLRARAAERRSAPGPPSRATGGMERELDLLLYLALFFLLLLLLLLLLCLLIRQLRSWPRGAPSAPPPRSPRAGAGSRRREPREPPAAAAQVSPGLRGVPLGRSCPPPRPRRSLSPHARCRPRTSSAETLPAGPRLKRLRLREKSRGNTVGELGPVPLLRNKVSEKSLPTLFAEGIIWALLWRTEI